MPRVLDSRAWAGDVFNPYKFRVGLVGATDISNLSGVKVPWNRGPVGSPAANSAAYCFDSSMGWDWTNFWYVAPIGGVYHLSLVVPFFLPIGRTMPAYFNAQIFTPLTGAGLASVELVVDTDNANPRCLSYSDLFSVNQGDTIYATVSHSDSTVGNGVLLQPSMAVGTQPSIIASFSGHCISR